MIHLCHAMEAPQDQVMVRVVPEVPDGQNLEQTEVLLKVVVPSVPHLLATMEHGPHPSVPITP